MQQPIRQTYRHLIQQQIVRQILCSQNAQRSGWEIRRSGWEASGILTLFSAAAVCGTLAQVHLG